MKRFLLLSILLLFTTIQAQEYWMENGSVTTCSGTFYDSGGPVAGYQPNENYVFTICPDRTSEPLNAVGLEFILRSIQTNRDLLNVYDGDNTSAPLITTIGGGADPVTVLASEAAINPSGCLTFEWISDGQGQVQGWEANIFCQIPCQTVTPTVVTVPARDADGNVTVLEGDTVTFTGSATFSQNDSGVSYAWDFGDGNTATGTNTTHTYADAGTYTVTFSITDANNCVKDYTFLVIVEYDNNVPCPSVEGIDTVENSSDVLVNCNYPLDQDGNMTLFAEYAVLKETTEYIVQSIPFQPPYGLTDYLEPAEISIDDTWAPVSNFPSAVGDIPAFKFCFFGVEKPGVQVGANGRLNFDLDRPVNEYGSDQWEFSSTLPLTATTPDPDMFNTINGAYHDINTAADPDRTDDFTYGYEGEYPCRFFVVNYNSVPLFSCSSARTSQQIVLWEGSNYIDVYLHNKPACPNWNNGNSLVGLQGPSVGQYAVAPGRNTGNWTAQNEAWRFIPSGPEMAVEIAWYDEDGTRVGQAQELEIAPRSDTYYEVYVTYSICGQAPIVVRDRININFDFESPAIENLTRQVCDVDGDDTNTWDLGAITANVLDNQPEDFELEGYYTTFAGADQNLDTTEITTPNAFESGSTVVYVRVENTRNGCHGVFEINLDFLDDLQPEPLTETACIPPTATEAVYNLNTYIPTFQNGQFYDVFFYLNQADAEANADSYLQGTDLSEFTISATTTLYVRVQTEDGCYGITELTLELNDGPDDYDFTDPVSFCDNPVVGEEIVNLTGYETVIANGQTGLTFYYFTDYDAAVNLDLDNDIDDPTQFNLTSDVTMIYIVVQDENGCYKPIEMPVVLSNGLSLNTASISLCDLDNSGSEDFDLSSVNEDIIINSGDYTFTYYPTEDDANNLTNEITSDITQYTNGSGTIWVIVTDANGCFGVTTIALTLNTVPQINPAALSVCMDVDGNLVFDLSQAASDILNGQTGITLSYFNTLADATDNVVANAIADINNYTGTAGEIIYVRLENAEGCHSVAELTLNQYPQPEANDGNLLPVCDVDSNGVETIDLTQNEAVVTGGATDVTVTYYLTLSDAQAPQNPISNPANYEANNGSTIIYVRVESTDGCAAFAQFEVQVLDGLPLTPASITLCDVGEDGTENFDITSMNDVISNNVSTYTFEYFASLTDLQNNNPISGDLTQYASGNTTILVLASTANCSSYTELSLELKDLPAVNQNQEWLVCDQEFDGVYGFTLTDLNDVVVNNTSGLSFEYYTSQSDAENQTNAFTQADANNVTSLPMQVWVRVEETSDNPNCTNYVAVTLNVGEQTQVNTAIDPEIACDDGFGTATFNLTNMANAVTNETVDHWVSYHVTLANAQNDQNPINPDNAVLGNGTVYVRVTADGKCPSITQFDVNIVPKPLAEIFAPTAAYCMTDSLQISANGFDPSLTYNWTNQLGASLGNTETIQLMGNDGDQTITLTVTDPNSNCISETTMDFDAVDIPVITSLNTTNNSISVSASGQGPFEYSIDGGTTWQTNSSFTELQPGMYTVLIRSLNGGCEGISMATLVLDVANVITPNNDGLNDYFRVPFMDAFRDEAGNVQASNFYIYDRYGKLLYQDVSSNEKTEFIWHGTSNGRTLPSGDYWYLLELADGRKAMGHITVKNR